MKIEVSNGEVLDRVSILYIKLNNINDIEKKANVQREYDTILPIFHLFTEKYGNDIINYYTQLVDVNTVLWNVEDELRKCESENNFGEKFIHLARMVYNMNDKRAAIKKQINIFTNSKLIEEKGYHPYTT